MYRTGAWLFIAAIACSEDEKGISVNYLNEGQICLSPREDGGTHVQGILDTCVSSCARIHATCSASARDNLIEVIGEAVVTRVPNIGPCQDECGLVEARCSLPKLPDGVYQLESGERTRNVRFPIGNPRTEVFLGVEAVALDSWDANSKRD